MVIINAGENCLQCDVCGEKHKIDFPIEIIEFCRQAEAFEELHKNCKKNERNKC